MMQGISIIAKTGQSSSTPTAQLKTSDAYKAEMAKVWKEHLNALMPESRTDEKKDRYDFTDMSRREIERVGKQLFSEGKITIDELFHFQHPDGKLHIGLDGLRVELPQDERIDFVSHIRRFIELMQENGDDRRADSGYSTLLGLLEKLRVLGA